MAIIVELPRLSDTMEEGVIAKWHVGEGDKVKRGQVIAEIETDKATMEFESFDAGTVLKLVAPEGETLALGAPIAVLGKPGEDFSEALSSHKGGNGEGASKPSSAPTEIPSAKPTQGMSVVEEEPEAPEAPEAIEAPEAAPEAPEAATASASRDEGRIAASPLARRLAREHGLSLADIEGTGPHGRVVKTDVLAAVERGATRAAATVTSGPRSFLSRPDTPMQLSQMRKAIAKRMGQANAEIPHFYLTIAANMDNAVALREQLKQALPDVKISFNDIVVMAVAHALKKHPEVNAYWDGKTIVQKGDIHVGVAVALDDGLIVPVVRFAEQKSLSEIAVEIRDLGTRARDKKLGPKEITGSSFTVSNLGMFGIEAFSAVINPGEGAILAVGAITDDAVVEDGQVTVSKRMRMTLACDHRAMDGAVGANFLATLRAVLEQPLAMMA